MFCQQCGFNFSDDQSACPSCRTPATPVNPWVTAFPASDGAQLPSNPWSGFGAAGATSQPPAPKPPATTPTPLPWETSQPAATPWTSAAPSAPSVPAYPQSSTPTPPPRTPDESHSGGIGDLVARFRDQAITPTPAWDDSLPDLSTDSGIAKFEAMYGPGVPPLTPPPPAPVTPPVSQPPPVPFTASQPPVAVPPPVPPMSSSPPSSQMPSFPPAVSPLASPPVTAPMATPPVESPQADSSARSWLGAGLPSVVPPSQVPQWAAGSPPPPVAPSPIKPPPPVVDESAHPPLISSTPSAEDTPPSTLELMLGVASPPLPPGILPPKPTASTGPSTTPRLDALVAEPPPTPLTPPEPAFPSMAPGPSQPPPWTISLTPVVPPEPISVPSVDSLLESKPRTPETPEKPFATPLLDSELTSSESKSSRPRSTFDSPLLDIGLGDDPKPVAPKAPVLDSTAPMATPVFDDPPPAIPPWAQPQKPQTSSLPDSLFRDADSSSVRSDAGYTPALSAQTSGIQHPEALGLDSILRDDPRPPTGPSGFPGAPRPANDPWGPSGIGDRTGPQQRLEETGSGYLEAPLGDGKAVIVGGRTSHEVTNNNAKRDKQTLSIVLFIVFGMVLIAIAAALFLLLF